VNQVNRINWIDWAKVFTMILVVFGHCSFTNVDLIYKNLVYSFHVPLFFLLSGYLHKDSKIFISYLKKNIRSLIVPYILLNALVLFAFLLPEMIIQNNYSRLLKMIFYFFVGYGHAPAGPCWFLICLFLIKIYSFFILKTSCKYQVLITIILPCIAFVFISIFGKSFAHNSLTSPLASFTSFIFFIIGFYLKQKDIIKKLQNTIVIPTIIIAPILLYLFAEIQGYVNVVTFGNYPVLYYPQAFIGCFLIISICYLLNNFQSNLIITLSSGTLLILAFHGLIYGYAHRLFNFSYSAFNNIIVSILITIFLYYPIIFVQKYCPILIGDRKIK